MATQIFPTRPQRVDRRRFLLSATATVACTGVAPVEQVDAAKPEVIRIGPQERPRTDIEAWNVGLISARRPTSRPPRT